MIIMGCASGFFFFKICVFVFVKRSSTMRFEFANGNIIGSDRGSLCVN